MAQRFWTAKEVIEFSGTRCQTFPSLKDLQVLKHTTSVNEHSSRSTFLGIYRTIREEQYKVRKKLR